MLHSERTRLRIYYLHLTCRLSVRLFRIYAIFSCSGLSSLTTKATKKNYICTHSKSFHSQLSTQRRRRHHFCVCSYDLFSIQIEHTKTKSEQENETKSNETLIFISFAEFITLIDPRRCVVQLRIVSYLVKKL